MTTAMSDEEHAAIERELQSGTTLADLAARLGMDPKVLSKRHARWRRNPHRGVATVAPELAAVVQTAPLDPRDRAPNSSKDPSRNPDLHTAGGADGYPLRGVSTLVDADGNVVQRWIKTGRSQQDQIEALRRALEYMPEPFHGAADPVDAPVDTASDLLAVYPIADAHIGMYAWGEETGASYDLKEAERLHVEAMDRLVSAAPPADHAIICSLGDWFHSDNSRNRTEKAGNILDVDTRWARVLRVGLRTMRRCVDRALERHGSVRVLCKIGNHDTHTSMMLALYLEGYYSRERRVIVETSPDPFSWARWGSCLLGFCHGDEAKPGQLPGIMAADKAREWGETMFRRWYTGHRHKLELQEHPGCIVETLSSLVARDAWAHRAGYRSRRAMRCDIWHATRGDIMTHRVGVEELGRP